MIIDAFTSLGSAVRTRDEKPVFALCEEKSNFGGKYDR